MPWTRAKRLASLSLTFYLLNVAPTSTYLVGFLSESRELMFVKMLEQCLTLGKCPLSEGIITAPQVFLAFHKRVWVGPSPAEQTFHACYVQRTVTCARGMKTHQK